MICFKQKEKESRVVFSYACFLSYNKSGPVYLFKAFISSSTDTDITTPGNLTGAAT